MLVLYGVGVTVGAGIFALIGDVAGLAADHAPLAFIVAGVIAAATGYSYAVLAAAFPRAGGEAIFATMGLGHIAGLVTGVGVLATAVISSAVISLAFAGYVTEFLGFPQPLIAMCAVIGLSAIAAWGVRESVLFAAAITVLETATLLVIIATGIGHLDADAARRIVSIPSLSEWGGITSAAFLAFFAFIGFEDIENMAEETRNPGHVLPLAITLTLVIAMILYTLIASVAVAVPGAEGLADHPAPLARVFELATGRTGRPIAAMAAIAMINGILVQILMASRLIYGMAREGLLPAMAGRVSGRTGTPLIAIALVSAFIIVLVWSFPLTRLAEATSTIILCVFAAVNFSLWRIGMRADAPLPVARARHWGLIATVLCFVLLAAEAMNKFG